LGIIQLPKGSRLGVLTAYRFYRNLFNKIRKTESRRILEARIRISNTEKAALLMQSILSSKLNLL